MTQRPRLLDLFCCEGGASIGYARAGFDVVGVDIDHQQNYPDPTLGLVPDDRPGHHCRFIRGDAMRVLADRAFLSQFAVVHASPPCQG